MKTFWKKKSRLISFLIKPILTLLPLRNCWKEYTNLETGSCIAWNCQHPRVFKIVSQCSLQPEKLALKELSQRADKVLLSQWKMTLLEHQKEDAEFLESSFCLALMFSAEERNTILWSGASLLRCNCPVRQPEGLRCVGWGTRQAQGAESRKHRSALLTLVAVFRITSVKSREKKTTQSQWKQSHLSPGIWLACACPMGLCCNAGLCLAEFVPDGGPWCSIQMRKQQKWEFTQNCEGQADLGKWNIMAQDCAQLSGTVTLFVFQKKRHLPFLPHFPPRFGHPCNLRARNAVIFI